MCTSGGDGIRWGVSVFRLQGHEEVPSAERANAPLPPEEERIGVEGGWGGMQLHVSG